MEPPRSFRGLIALISFVGLLISVFVVPTSASKPKGYIVYMGSSPEPVDKPGLVAAHHDLLASVLKSVEAAKKSILYSYTYSFNGFAAKLLPKHAAELSRIPGVISVFPNKNNHLHTTRSWEFMRLESKGQVPVGSLWNKSNFGADVIIGSLDTGVWPEADSFRDDSFGPIPEKWKGTCVNGTAFNASHCNKKLIGAKFYIKGYELQYGPLNMTATGDFRSPRDNNGHGTHTSSTAGGRFVSGANVLGFANGTAKGGAPMARIAIYKVCWPKGCYESDILAALDDAVQDGVDILTLSLGGFVPLPQLFEDGTAIGAFHAVQKGITVVCSAGNAGPKPGSVVNVAPWILTVAASSVDRDFRSYVILGDGTTYKGNSFSESKLDDTSYPLVSGGDIPASSVNSSDSILCKVDSLDPAKAKGKIVVCLRGVTSRVSKGLSVLLAGGVGMILANSPSDGAETVADAHVLPATNVDAKNGAAIFAYINSSSSPTAYITPATTVLGVRPAPTMASFSSQGPNTLIPDLLKPDVTAPGLNILAAFAEASTPSGTSRTLKFNIASGTSMSCPHVAGISALLKALHPEWSPAAIKSAIMTTANIHDNRGQLILSSDSQVAGPFNYGSGHVDPNAAADPGLVYDATTQDYVLFLCSLKYGSAAIKVLTGRDVTCPDQTPAVSNFNYPSVAISNLNRTATVTRTVTSVGGNCASTYDVFVRPPPGVSVSVQPSRMFFSSSGQKQSFTIKFTVKQASAGKYVFGYFIWSDGRHLVRSSIAVNAVAAATSADAPHITLNRDVEAEQRAMLAFNT